LLFGIAHIKWDEVESEDDDEPVEMCPTTSTTTTEHQTSTFKQGDKRSEKRVSLEEAVQPPPRGILTVPNREASTFYGEGACLVAKKKSKKKRQSKGAKSQKIEDSRSLSRDTTRNYLICDVTILSRIK
jgi:hypothetical protein